MVDRDPSKASKNIWSVNDVESNNFRQPSCVTTECASTTEQLALSAITEQEVQDLKNRFINESTRYGNGRDGHLSLSSNNQRIEDAAAVNTTDGSAHTDVSEVYLARLIREFSPKLTVTEMMFHILAWVGPVDKLARKDEEKERRASKFESFKSIILDVIKDIWIPSVSIRFSPPQRIISLVFQNGEEFDKLFLSRTDYASAVDRLKRGKTLDDAEIAQLLNTVKGLDALVLLGECLHHDLVDSTDVTQTGEALAAHYCTDGYSFALYTLFKSAGDKMMRHGDSEKGACSAMNKAVEALCHNTHTYEDRDFHIVSWFGPLYVDIALTRSLAL